MQTHGYEVQTEDALQAWQAYSLTYASHWLSVWAVPEQEIVEAILSSQRGCSDSQHGLWRSVQADAYAASLRPLGRRVARECDLIHRFGKPHGSGMNEGRAPSPGNTRR